MVLSYAEKIHDLIDWHSQRLSRFIAVFLNHVDN